MAEDWGFKDLSNQTRHYDSEYVECECGDASHVLHMKKFDYDVSSPDEGFIFIGYHLTRTVWYKRLWYGIRYIFGHRSKYGEFGEIVLTRTEARRMAEFLVSERSGP